MACNTCFTSCPIHPKYGNIYVCKATPLNKYLVKITHIGSGRQVSEEVQANASGYVIITGGTFENFFHNVGQFKFQLFQVDYSVSPSVTSSIPVDFYAITGFGGAYYSVTLTVSSTVYDCALVEFEMIYDGDGDPLEIDNQYLTDV